VDLVEVNVIHAETPQAGVDARHDRLARKAARIEAFAEWEINLGRDHNLIAIGEVTNRAAQKLLAGAIGVGVGRIEKVDAQLQRAAKERARLFFRQRPGVRAAIRIAVGHTSQADARYLHSSSAQSCVVHVLCSFMK
jgi:hypothetical protein